MAHIKAMLKKMAAVFRTPLNYLNRLLVLVILGSSYIVQSLVSVLPAISGDSRKNYLLAADQEGA